MLSMYVKWAEKQGYVGRLVEKCPVKGVGIKSATLDFEFAYAYGYLSGERGIHAMIRGSNDASILLEVCLSVPVIFVSSYYPMSKLQWSF